MPRKSQETKTIPPEIQQPAHADDPLMTLTECANFVGKSRQTIGRLCSDGFIKHKRKPGSPAVWLVRKSDLLKFLSCCDHPVAVGK